MKKFLFYTIAKQVDQLNEGLEEVKPFKNELVSVLKAILQTQNEMKQELFLIRNNQSERSNKPQANHTGSSKTPPAAGVSSAPPKVAKSTENVVIVNTEKENKSKRTKADVKSHSGDKKNIIWFGTLISKALDRNKFEEDTQTKMKFVKAFGIKAEDDQFFPELNVTDTVNKVLEKMSLKQSFYKLEALKYQTLM